MVVAVDKIKLGYYYLGTTVPIKKLNRDETGHSCLANNNGVNRIKMSCPRHDDEIIGIAIPIGNIDKLDP